MEKRMEPLSVSTKGGQIWIEQDHGAGDEGGVVVNPNQVPTLVQWLQDAATELLSEKKDKSAA